MRLVARSEMRSPGSALSYIGMLLPTFLCHHLPVRCVQPGLGLATPWQVVGVPVRGFHAQSPDALSPADPLL
jgi:hypothetical protein